ncbi:MAG: hypothetical protein N2246_01105 [Candidatus Sumerlaeia bacterium]|nr:hypothetical protein [Candidatus Sumerlaeia bacterium]
MKASDRLSQYLLILGILFCLCLIAVITPLSFWEKILKFFLGSGYSSRQFFEYSFRSMMFAYVIIGLYFLVMAREPQRYKSLIFVTLAAFLANAVVCFFVGLSIRMAALVYLFDTTLFLVFALLLLYFWKPRP